MNAFRATSRVFTSNTSFTKAPGTWRSKLASFCVGASLAGGLGYIRLQKDIYAASNDVKKELSYTQQDVSKLVARIEELEKKCQTCPTA